MNGTNLLRSTCFDQPARAAATGSLAARPRGKRNRFLAYLQTGLIGLVLWAQMPGLCRAQSNQSGQAGSTAPAATSGIRDPRNPQQYMLDLSQRLGTGVNRDVFLRGLNTTPSSSNSGAFRVLQPEGAGGTNPLPANSAPGAGQLAQPAPRNTTINGQSWTFVVDPTRMRAAQPSSPADQNAQAPSAQPNMNAQAMSPSQPSGFADMNAQALSAQPNMNAQPMSPSQPSGFTDLNARAFPAQPNGSAQAMPPSEPSRFIDQNAQARFLQPQVGTPALPLPQESRPTALDSRPWSTEPDASVGRQASGSPLTIWDRGAHSSAPYQQTSQWPAEPARVAPPSAWETARTPAEPRLAPRGGTGLPGAEQSYSLNDLLAQLQQQRSARSRVAEPALPRQESGSEAAVRMLQAVDRARDLAEQLSRFEQQAAHLQRQLEWMEDQESQQARELRRVLEMNRQQMEGTQEELRAFERDIAERERQQQREAQRRRELVESHLRELQGPPEEELRHSLEVAKQMLQEMSQAPQELDAALPESPEPRDGATPDQPAAPDADAGERPAAHDREWNELGEQLHAMQSQINALERQVRTARENIDSPEAQRPATYEGQPRGQMDRIEGPQSVTPSLPGLQSSAQRPGPWRPEPDRTAAQPSSRPLAQDTGPLGRGAERGGIRQAIESRAPAQPEQPWSLGSDLDKYRAHAVTEGSRNSGQSAGFALRHTGMALEDTWNLVTLGYGTERAEPLRSNDGQGPLEQAGKALARGGDSIGNAAAGVYSLADLVTLNALPDSQSDVYRDNNPLVRPLLFTGRAIGNLFVATAEVGNALTLGLFDNVAGSAGMLFGDAVEVLKHAGQAVTNLARGPVYLLTGQKEGVDKTLDWVLLVPLEFASNSVEMQGITNMMDYETAFADKGVIGSLLELGGSTYILYRAVDEAVDELDDDDGSRSTNTDSGTPGQPKPPGGGSNPQVPSGSLYRGPDGEWYIMP